MSDAATSPELQKLAHSVGVSPDRLSGLAAVPPDDLRLLRSQIAEALFQADKPRFARMAALSSAVPVAVAAKVTEHALPPLLAARTAELIDPARAAELVSRLSDGYLAEVSAAMDAARAPDVVRRIPPDRVAKVAVELARREEWVVIGAFVVHISDEALAASIRALDGEQLLRVGYVLDEKSRLDEISAIVTDDQRDEMLAAAAKFELWTELDDLLVHLGATEASWLAARFSVAPDSVRSAASAAAKSGQLSTQALGLLNAG
ncbi:MAG TPA: hypothetical protein VJ831_13705 [Jatrophihabitantaceae bacterium]|nr:hypothetical protein [Jatrophihabitantaceae bacterium]